MSKNKKVFNKTKVSGNVVNKSHVKRNIPKLDDVSISDSFLIINFSEYPKWINSIKIGKSKDKNFFCNFYKNDDEIKKSVSKTLSSIFPKIQKNPLWISNGNNNCHIIKNDNNLLRRDKAVKVIKEIHGFDVDDDACICQIADGTGGVRVVGILITNVNRIFYPLFMDPHHLIYNGVKHNTPDFKSGYKHSINA